MDPNLPGRAAGWLTRGPGWRRARLPRVPVPAEISKCSDRAEIFWTPGQCPRGKACEISLRSASKQKSFPWTPISRAGRPGASAGGELGPTVPASGLPATKISKSSDPDQIRCARRWARGGRAAGVPGPCLACGPRQGRLLPVGAAPAGDYVPRHWTWRQVRKVGPLQEFLRYRLALDAKRQTFLGPSIP